MENLPLIQRGFASLPPTVTTYAFRADRTAPLHAVCAAVPEAAWQGFEARPDETVACAEVAFVPGDWRKEAEPLRSLALRIRKTQGQLFATGSDTKYLAVGTNRAGAVAALIRSHGQKAGTLDLVHDVAKNKLGAAGPPCGRFGATAAWYRVSLPTHKVLSALKALALPPALSAARPKRLRFALFTRAGRLLSHAGGLVLRISRAAERLASLIAARRGLALVAQALPAG